MIKHATDLPNASFIERIAWEGRSPENGILTVTMRDKGGRGYAYEDVPLSVYEDFCKAESAGKFYGVFRKQFDLINVEQR